MLAVNVPGTRSVQELELSVLLAEFNALRAEVIENFITARTILGLHFTAVGAIAALALSGDVHPRILILIPLISALLWWLHLDTRMSIGILGGYLNTVLRERAKQLTGSALSLFWEKGIRELKGSMEAETFWPLRGSEGVSWGAWSIYFIPSALALLLTTPGTKTVIPRTPPLPNSDIMALPGSLGGYSLWGFAIVLNLLLLARSFVTERAWMREAGSGWKIIRDREVGLHHDTGWRS